MPVNKHKAYWVKKNLSPRIFTERQGRLLIIAALLPMGPDLIILLMGGDWHLGALAMAGPKEETCHCVEKGHKDHLPAMDMAAKISSALGRNVGVICGIHFEHASPKEIVDILGLCQKLTERIIQALKTKNLRMGKRYVRYKKSGKLRGLYQVRLLRREIQMRKRRN